ncbi:E3 ubiquitin-protein ligase Iruka [Aethina tumida]|uniref:E3 ubiquitin-protein ligase Iruka n=1 Tax=Aethina tumida TaxID=116153 RepID=UPI00096B5704|nr:E3 ubiquitin-protein ligase Iruka [Aethina tumida]
MAEAAVEDRPTLKFYCHMCNVQFQNASANFTCPHCSDGFIEELQENPDTGDDVIDEDWEDDEMDDIPYPFPQVPDRRGRTSNRPGRRYPNSARARIIRPRTLTRLATSNLRQNNMPFENMIQEFFINLGVGVNIGTAANMQLFLGNPGDYAWGREGLDAIVTQLLNQMDSTGPPPVSKETIDALAVVKVDEEQVNSKLQCSVCWEDFVLREEVRQLPCLHIYHEPCIRPWLELHGTCPICRQNLQNAADPNGPDHNPESDSSSSSQDGNSAFNVIRNLFQNNPSSSSSNSNTDPSDQSGGRSHLNDF